MELGQIVAAVRVAIDERDSTRDALGERIRLACEQVLEVCGGEIRCGDAVIALREVSGYCSQGEGWGGCLRSERVVVLEIGAGTRSLGATPDLGYHDGHNRLSQQGATKDAAGLRVRPATVAQLRALAAGLPSVLAGMLAARRAQVEAEAAAAVSQPFAI